MALLLLATTAVAGCTCDLERRHPTDRELVENFREHRAQFEALRRMLDEDRGLFSIATGGGMDYGTGTVSKERLEAYRELLAELGVRGGLAVWPDRKTIELTVSSRGFVTHGSDKGYVFAPVPRPEEALLPDLDGITAKERGAARRELEGGWFLYFRGE